MSATQRGGGLSRGALAGVVKVLRDRLAPHPNHPFVTWIMKKIADFLHYFSRHSHIQGGNLQRLNTPE